MIDKTHIMETKQNMYQKPEIILVQIDCEISLTLDSTPWEDPITNNTLEMNKIGDLPIA